MDTRAKPAYDVLRTGRRLAKKSLTGVASAIPGSSYREPTTPSNREVMSMAGSSLKPATELARANAARIPNESAEFRRAREQLLAEEIELRRHIESVAELRRALPPG